MPTPTLAPAADLRWLWTVLLLIASNSFMTYAWYWHVKQPKWTLLMAIGISWLIALPEYILQVPANRLGHIDHGGPFTMPQLKILQEAITLIVFTIFSILVARESPKREDIIAMGLIMAAVGVSMWGKMKG